MPLGRLHSLLYTRCSSISSLPGINESCENSFKLTDEFGSSMFDLLAMQMNGDFRNDIFLANLKC